MKKAIKFLTVILLIVTFLIGINVNTCIALANEIRQNTYNELNNFKNNNTTNENKNQNEVKEEVTNENDNVTNETDKDEINDTENEVNSSENEVDNSQNEENKTENNIIDETDTNETDTNAINTENNSTQDETNSEIIKNEIIDEEMQQKSNTTPFTCEKTHDNGIYKMAIGANSNKAIEVKGGYTNNNAIVDIWDYGNALWQKFYFEYNEEGYYVITAMHTRKSLTVKNGNLTEGTEIVQADYEGLDSQKWILRDTLVNGWVISLQSNPELSISINGNISNGAEMILSKTEDNNNQMFYLFNITNEQKTYENGTYRMALGVDLTKAIEVKDNSKKENAGLEIGKYGNKTSQKFNLEYQEGGYYKITSLNSGKSLTVKDGNLTEGAEIVQADYEGLDSQKWLLRDSNINGWIISLFDNPQLSITVEGKIENGSKIILSKTEDNSKQIYNTLGVSNIEGERQQNGMYKIAVAVDANKTIEVKGGDINNNAIVDIWDYGNGSQQKFYFEYKEEGYYKIIATHTGKSLTAKGNMLAEGTEIVQADYEGLDSQKWILRNTTVNGWVISLQSNPELSISIKGSITNGAEMILSKSEDTNNQMFYLYNITSERRTHANGTYKIAVGADSNKAIEVKVGYTNNNDIVDIWDYGNADWQKFDFEYNDGYYKITAKHTGKSLTVKDNLLEEGTQIVQDDYQGLESQKWILRDSGKNGWVISLVSNPQLSITVKGNVENGSEIILSKTEDNNNQMFYISNTINEIKTHENGVYKFSIGRDSRKALEVKGGYVDNNAIVDIWDYGNVDWQKFNLEYQEGYYKITAKHTGKSLTVRDNNLQQGAEIVQDDYKGLDSQKWVLRDTGVNGWVISLLSNPDLSITVEGSIVNGAKMILSNTVDNDNQMLYIQKADLTIVINPGHGGSDGGCSNGWLLEKNVTLEIARKLRDNLSKYGINVILTRDGDYDIDLAPRAMIARNNNADLYISLHINDEVNHRATGSQMYVPFYEGTRHYNSNMTRLANLIQDKLGAIGISENISGGTTRRNIDQLPKYQYLMDGQVVQADYYADIRHAMKGDTMDYGPDLNTNTGIPTILVEHCFMNSSDSQFIDSDYDLQRIADADSAAIIEYFGL